MPRSALTTTALETAMAGCTLSNGFAVDPRRRPEQRPAVLRHEQRDHDGRHGTHRPFRSIRTWRPMTMRSAGSVRVSIRSTLAPPCVDGDARKSTTSDWSSVIIVFAPHEHLRYKWFFTSRSTASRCRNLRSWVRFPDAKHFVRFQFERSFSAARPWRAACSVKNHDVLPSPGVFHTRRLL